MLFIIRVLKVKVKIMSILHFRGVNPRDKVTAAAVAAAAAAAAPAAAVEISINLKYQMVVGAYSS